MQQTNSESLSEQAVRDASSAPDTSCTSSAPDVSGAPGVPDAPDTPSAPDASSTSNASDATNGPMTDIDTSKVDRLGVESLPKLITEFAIPSIVGTIVNAIYNIICSAFLGQAMGEIGLSVATVANPTMIIFLALAMLIGVGGNALCALRMGEGRRDDAEMVLGNTVTLGIIVWLIVALIAINPFLLDQLLTLSSATDEVRPYAATYIRILCVGFCFQNIGFGINNFIRTAGRPNRALVTMIIGAVVCTFCCWIFVIVLDLQVVGAAAATLIGQAASCASVLWFFLFTKDVPFKLRLRCMRPKWSIISTVLVLGLAPFAVQIGSAVVNFVINYQLFTLGAMHVVGSVGAQASIGVVQRIAMFTVMPLVGTANAIQPILGYNYGAKNYKRVRTCFWEGVAGATVISVIMFAIVHLWPTQIVGWFGIESVDLMEFTVYALQVQLLMLPFVGFQILGGNYFQATGQPLKSILLSLSRQVIFLVPLLLIMPMWLPAVFPQFEPLDAMYVATPVADFLAIFTTVILIAWEMRRIQKLQRGEIVAKY